MSLFSAREWWHAQPTANGQAEEFDGGAMCIANIDNDTSGAVKVITGSFQGILRIFLPRQRDYRAEDLLLEAELDQAVLQLAAGRFSLGGGLQLAVLHPRKLVVYVVQSVGGSYLQLGKLYEHFLEHTAANMVYGPFGGAQGIDYICIQSYDGQLSVFECETPAFSRFLPNFLVPGPLCYCEASDSLITCNASFELESYKFKVLAAATGDKQTDNPKVGHQVSKKLQADWHLVLGEAAIDIRSGKLSQNLQAYQSDIVVLCEHHLFIVSVNGQITFQKRLEYHPACCTIFPAPSAKVPGGQDNLLVSTFTKSLLVYRGSLLFWSARAETQPVAIQVADVGGVRGMIVTMDDAGHVVVSYLGTDPLVHSMGFVEGKELDYEAMAREHRQLAGVIRECSGGKRTEPQDKLIMRTQVPATFNSLRGGELDNLAGGGRVSKRDLTVKLYLAYQGGATSLDNVTVSVRPPAPVTTEAATILVPSVSGNAQEPSLVLITFSAGTTCLPTNNIAQVVASYTTPSGEPRAQQLAVELPLCLFCSIVPPVKGAAYKLTVDTNRKPPQITALFEDLMAQAGPGVAQSMASNPQGANVLSLQYYSGEDCTILVSKNAGRYRLQSDDLHAMWLVLQELCRRLVAYYREAEGGADAPEGPLTITFDEALPLEDVFELVDNYFEVRQQVLQQKTQLEDRAIQFRMVEKRLLMRFKDKNPAPLNQLDFLMEETYSQVMALGESLDANQDRLAKASTTLAGALQLLLLLIRFKFGLSSDEAALMASYLSPEVVEAGDVGWVEHTEASLTHLLRSAMAKSAKEQSVSVGPLAPAKDTAKLKKHLSLVLERLARGQRPQLGPDDARGGGPALGR